MLPIAASHESAKVVRLSRRLTKAESSFTVSISLLELGSRVTSIATRLSQLTLLLGTTSRVSRWLVAPSHSSTRSRPVRLSLPHTSSYARVQLFLATLEHRKMHLGLAIRCRSRATESGSFEWAPVCSLISACLFTWRPRRAVITHLTIASPQSSAWSPHDCSRESLTALTASSSSA